jgi:hypothetical protein
MAKKVEILAYFYRHDKASFQSLLPELFNSMNLNQQINLINRITTKGRMMDRDFFLALNEYFAERYNSEHWFKIYQQSIQSYQAMISKIKLLQNYQGT